MELIGNGAQADVFRRGNIAIKLFRNNVSKSNIVYEKNLQRTAYEFCLPVPKVYDIIELNEKYGIVMEYIAGISLGKLLMENSSESEELFIKSIRLQNIMHKIETNNFPPMKDKLIGLINNADELTKMEKNKIINRMEYIEFDNKLCHGDFHVFNLIQTSYNIKIIDWANATSGNPEADISRTYLIYKLFNEDIAELYLETYCKMYKKDKSVILFWVPIFAAARLGEYVKDENEKMLLKEIISRNI